MAPPITIKNCATFEVEVWVANGHSEMYGDTLAPGGMGVFHTPAVWIRHNTRVGKGQLLGGPLHRDAHITDRGVRPGAKCAPVRQVRGLAWGGGILLCAAMVVVLWYLWRRSVPRVTAGKMQPQAPPLHHFRGIPIR